ncbi:MAG: 3-oxoacyl-ACP synthase III [Phycisphaerae bacterium]|nr:3-oxoacyl-ACP synthase III [Phycisphaerae bacterium]
MNYSRVHMDAIGYELPPVVVTSQELENRLAPLYEKLHMEAGQLEALTGIRERRWWEEGHPLSQGAISAARKALAQTEVEAGDLEAVVYTGVCRENFEPATACAVASALGVHSDAYIYDISNACLGMLNGIIDLANRIELKQIRAGMVVSCESSREINEIMIERMLAESNIEFYTSSLATLTGGSGAAAVILTDGSFGDGGHRLRGAATKAAPEHHELCRWGVSLSPVALGKLIFSPDKLLNAFDELTKPETLPTALKDLMTNEKLPSSLARLMPSEKLPEAVNQFMHTDSVAVLKHGARLGVRTWGAFLSKLGWAKDQVDKVICHQVGSGHRDTILRELGIPPEKDYPTYRFLGNIGTVSLPLTAALADKRRFLLPGQRVGFLGIGSGLNCLMLGWEW